MATGRSCSVTCVGEGLSPRLLGVRGGKLCLKGLGGQRGRVGGQEPVKYNYYLKRR